MAGRETADIVFCIDASESMRPAIDGVRDHVVGLLRELQSDPQRTWDVRFDFLTQGVGFQNGSPVYMLKSVLSEGLPLTDSIYHPTSSLNQGPSGFFTRDIDLFRQRLDSVECRGDEEMALALDIAADYPFRDAATCHRVVVLLTDEPIETGVQPEKAGGLIGALAQKLQQKRIMLFMVTPSSESYDALSQVDRCEWKVIQRSDTGLSTVDFSKLMVSIGKSVSVAQTGPSATDGVHPLFGQEGWVAGVADSFTERV